MFLQIPIRGCAFSGGRFTLLRSDKLGMPVAILQLEGDPDITVQLRRNARARRLSLRVSHLDGRVTLTLPVAASATEALDFANEKESWIRRQLGNRPKEIPLQIGSTVLFEGAQVPIVASPTKSIDLINGQILVPGDPGCTGVRVAAFFKVLARDRLSLACDHYAGELGVSVRQISLRDTRSRWGSCTAQGRLMFSWRLIMAPTEVLDYVAAHEVSHLVEMNHSPDYWSVVQSICPNYQKPRKWLRANGARLHAYSFAKLT